MRRLCTHQVLLPLFLIAAAGGLAGFGFPEDARAADWTQWRGPVRTGQATEGERWPDSLNEKVLVPIYEIPLGPGYSGPIVAGDRVFVTETVDKKLEVVRALNRGDGLQIWKVEWPGAMTVPFFAAANGSWIRSTPVFDGTTLYVCGMLDVLVALDGETGRERWRTDFTKEFSTAAETFGFVCSPLIDGDSLYVQTGGGLARVRCDTGAVVWRSLKEDSGMMGGAFSSPVMATLADRRQLVVQTRAALAGVDPENGDVLWSVDVPSFRGMNILTPTVMGNRIFTSSYGGGSFLFEVTRNGDQLAVGEVWKQNLEAYMSSPVLVDGKLYVHLRNQRFTCLDPETGESLWTSRPFGKYWSMVENGGRLLVLDERSELLLIDAQPQEYRQLDSRQLADSPTWAHLAVTDNHVYVRHLDRLAVFRWKPAE